VCPGDPAPAEFIEAAANPAWVVAAQRTPKQKAEFRRKQFNRALDWAEAQELIAIHEINHVVYLRLCSQKSDDDKEEG
jgi:hypothetical protein